MPLAFAAETPGSSSAGSTILRPFWLRKIGVLAEQTIELGNQG